MRIPLEGNPRITSRHGELYGNFPGVPPELVGTPHNGIDYGVVAGTPVYAPFSGKITFSGYDKGLGIKIENETFTDRLWHLSKSIVSKGAVVTEGQLIGYSGNSGGVLAHLHWDRYDKWTKQHIDPLAVQIDMNLEAFKQIFITLHARWPEDGIIKAWQKTGKSAYTYAQEKWFYPLIDGLKGEIAKLQGQIVTTESQLNSTRKQLDTANQTIKRQMETQAELTKEYNKNILNEQQKYSDKQQELEAVSGQLRNEKELVAGLKDKVDKLSKESVQVLSTGELFTLFLVKLLKRGENHE